MEPKYGIFLMYGSGSWGEKRLGYTTLYKVGTNEFKTPEEANAYIETNSLPRHQFIIMEYY